MDGLTLPATDSSTNMVDSNLDTLGIQRPTRRHRHILRQVHGVGICRIILKGFSLIETDLYILDVALGQSKVAWIRSGCEESGIHSRSRLRSSHTELHRQLTSSAVESASRFSLDGWGPV